MKEEFVKSKYQLLHNKKFVVSAVLDEKDKLMLKNISELMGGISVNSLIKKIVQEFLEKHENNFKN